MSIKKLLITLLSLVLAVSCSSGLEPEASQEDADLINKPDPVITAFINNNVGAYYNSAGYINYKLRYGKLQNVHGKEIKVEAVSTSEGKLQVRYANRGIVEVLKFDSKGYTAYTSFILEKVSDRVLIDHATGGYIGEFAQYKGTYKDASRGITNFIAIDENGTIYFHDTNVTKENGKIGITEGEGLTIIDSGLGKVIFKFNQGVYRKYNINGAHIDKTGERFTRTTDFVDDLAGYAYSGGGISVKLGAGTLLNGADYPDSTIRIGNTVKILKMGVTLTLSEDFKTAAYKDKNGKTATLTRVEVK